ncbi:MAG: hypothetical protein GZ091_03630 [Paludibacter sp.]|nr:hypothetical protein [Paludibacter sp.]
MRKILKTEILHFILLTVISAGSLSCKHDPDISTSPQIGFNEIKSIINNKCSSCHGVAGSELFLIDSVRIMEFVVPFQPNSSLLFNTVTNTYSGNFMPPSPEVPLNKEQRTKLYMWIIQGANPKSISLSGNS